MGEIHAINSDGTVIKNIEVFARWLLGGAPC